MSFPTLYKFREIKECHLEAIRDEKVWFSNVESFNDPFELYYKVISGINEHNFNDAVKTFSNYISLEKDLISNIDDPKIIEQILGLVCKKTNKIAEDKIELLKDTSLIFSLSKTNSHPLLWGHYGDGLKGMCIEYNFNNQNFQPGIGSCNVNYEEKPFELNVLEMILTKSRIHDYSESIYGTKNKVWCYEEELRLIADIESLEDNSYQLSNGVITSIIIGERASNKNFEKVTNLAKDKKIPLKIAKALREKFTVTIDDFK